MNHPQGTQTISHRLDNKYEHTYVLISCLFVLSFYNYRENGYGEDAYYTVLLQDGIVSPGTLLVNTPSQAVGYDTFNLCEHVNISGVFSWILFLAIRFFQFEFTVQNQPYPNGALPVRKDATFEH